MKKVIRLFLSIFIVFVITSTKFISANFDNDLTETGGAGYQIVERKTTNDLGYDVLQYTDIAQTTRSGLLYNQQVNVMEIPSSSKAKIISYANLDYNRWTLTTVKELAKKFEASNPDWKVIGAINADFFDINGKLNLPYQTQNPVITQGEVFKSGIRDAALGFTNDGTSNTLVSGKNDIFSQDMILSIYNENNEIITEFPIDKINTVPDLNQTSVFYGTYNATHTYVGVAVDSTNINTYYVENAELALPNSDKDFYGKGVISSIDGGNLQKGQFAIQTNNLEVINYLDLGVKIRVQYDLIGDFANVTAATGYVGKFLENSEFLNQNVGVLNERHPRTAVGVKADGTIIMTVIDGRQTSSGMDGVYGDEMAAIMKRYGCVEAYNLDGGGSSTIIIRQGGEFVVMNSPSDGNERKDANCLLVAVQMPEINVSFSQEQEAITFNIELIRNNQFDIKDLLLEFNGEVRKVEDSPLTFTNLRNNTEYYYAFQFKDSNDVVHQLVVDGKVKTLKITPYIKSLEIFESSEFYEITLLYDDPDNTNAFNIPTISINGRLSTIRKGSLILKKSVIGSDITEIKVSYKYDLNDGITIEVTTCLDYILTSSEEIIFFQIIYECQNNIISNIYQ